MNTLPNALPDRPLNDVTAGLDWARDDHAVSVVNARGQEIGRCTVEHSAAGLRDLIVMLGRNGVGEVAIDHSKSAPARGRALRCHDSVDYRPMFDLRGHGNMLRPSCRV